MFQGIMVGIENKLTMKEIMSPVFYCLDYRIKLDVICAVAQARIGEFLTKKAMGRFCWLITAPIPVFDASLCNSKAALKFRRARIGVLHNLSLMI